jgi:hypothetical protein
VFFSAVVLILSIALFLFYLQVTCENVLRRKFGQPYFRAIVKAYHLEFSSPRQISPVSVRTSLRVDFLKLTSLMKDVRLNGCRSYRESLLKLYFRTILFLMATTQPLGVRQTRSVRKLTAILQYFANLIGECEPAFQHGALTPSQYLMSL